LYLPRGATTRVRPYSVVLSVHPHKYALSGSPTRCIVDIQRSSPSHGLGWCGKIQLSAVQDAGISRFVLRGAKNFAARRNLLPPYKGRGRAPEYGALVRPLARKRKGARLPPHPLTEWKPGRRMGWPFAPSTGTTWSPPIQRSVRTTLSSTSPSFTTHASRDRGC
jgi:hypothetical protein